MILKLNKKNIIILIIISLILFVIFSVFYSINQNYNKVTIINLDEYIKDLPKEQKISLNESLQNIINPNELQNNDANIRDDSYKETYNESDNFYSSTFIIDIPKIEQSYKILFSWSKDNNIIIKGDTLKLNCLENEEIIYSNFNCYEKLGLSEPLDDPILDILPQSTFNYQITLGSLSNEKLGLNINIFLYSYDTRDGNRSNSIEKYKKNAIDWMKSKNLDINNYDIKYIIN